MGSWRDEDRAPVECHIGALRARGEVRACVCVGATLASGAPDPVENGVRTQERLILANNTTYGKLMSRPPP